MCGINGFFNYAGVQLADEAKLVKKMNDKIGHRGPDGEGIWNDSTRSVFLGHRRLSIIDLAESANQPMFNKESRDALVFNGEIYNYKSLKKDLHDVRWQTNSDTEVLFQMLSRNGLSSLDQLNGMFAFAYWDESNEQLHIAQDELGKKPLYYTNRDGIFAFSSEIKGLLELPWVHPEIDKTSFYHFLTFNQVAPPATMFKGIKKLAPGEVIVVGKSGVQRQYRYSSNPLKSFPYQSEKDWADAIHSQLERSVEARMVSDVPVGAFLSGGVDSSAVVAKMSKFTDKTISTFTIGFEGQPDYDERKFAEQVAKQYGTNHHEKVVSPGEVEALMGKIAYIFDDPMADTTGIPIYFLSQKAREENIKVILTGDGADEMFCGYRNWMKYLKYEPTFKRFKKLPYPLKAMLSGAFTSVKPNHPAADILSRAKDNREFFWGGAKSFKESAKRKYLHPSFFDGMDDLDSYSVMETYKQEYSRLFGDKDDLMSWMGFLGMEFMIPNWYMTRMDKLGMANSIEIRSPIVDTELKALALACPNHLKIKGGEPKYIFKKSLEGTLDHDILYRAKKGFCLPIQEWGSDIMLNYLDANIKTFCEETNLLNFSAVKDQVAQFRTNPNGRVNDIFALYYLINWYKEWM